MTAGKGEKGKGKSKSKGRGKGGKAQGSRDGQACEKCGRTNHTTAECTYFDGACRYCGTHGHRERDCRKKQAASKGGGETAAVVTTPGPTTGQVAFVGRRQTEDESGWILGVTRAATKEPGTKTVGAVEFIVDSGSEATILNTGLADQHGVDRAASSASLYHIGGGDLNCSTRGSLHGQLRDEKWGPFPVALECHVGDVQRNVLSVSRLVDQGCTVSFGPDGCWIQHQGRCVNLNRQGGLFTLRVERPSGRKGQEAMPRTSPATSCLSGCRPSILTTTWRMRAPTILPRVSRTQRSFTLQLVQTHLPPRRQRRLQRPSVEPTPSHTCHTEDGASTA